LIVGIGEPENMAAGVEGWKNYLSNYIAGGLGSVPGMNLELYAPYIWGLTEVLQQGTVLLDIDHPFSLVPRKARNLIDAWGNPYTGKFAYFVPTFPKYMRDFMFNIPHVGKWIEFGLDQAGDMPSFYVALGKNKPGYKQPDIWEYLNLSFYPMYAGFEQGGGNPGPDNEAKVMKNVRDMILSDYPTVAAVEIGYEAAVKDFHLIRKWPLI